VARRRRQRTSRRSGIGLLLLLAGVLLALGFLPRATGAALLFGRWQRLALGVAAPAIPLVIFLTGAVITLARGRARVTLRVQGLALGAVAAAAAVHAFVPAGHEFAAARAGQGTGAVGAALAWAGRAVVGEGGLWVLILLVAVVAVLRFFVVPLPRLIDWLLAAGRAAVCSVRVLLQGGTAVALLAMAGTGAAARGLFGLMRIGGRGSMQAARLAQAALVARRGQPGGASQVDEADFALEPSGNGAAVDEVLLPLPAAVAVGSGSGTAEAAPVPPAARRRPQRVRERVHQESLLPEPAPGSETERDRTPAVYERPPLELLGDPLRGARAPRGDPGETARALEQTLASFGVEAKVVHWEQGPVVTRYEVQPGAGVKVQKITSLTNDIALNLAAPSVRIEAPIPGKSAVGIEIPNQKSSLVHIKEILTQPSFQTQVGSLIVALGKNLTGQPIVADLTEMPHLLIAGATGSGKSVALNAIIASLLFRYTPDEVRFVMIDPKRIEMTNYNDIPHLLIPVVTNPRAAAGALKQMLRVMEERFERFAAAGVRNIQAYNELADADPLPFIVIVVDELADLMMVAPADFEDVIVRLAQMTRATGIHLVVATQRPSVDVITGLIKANIPSRIAFAVSSQVDSRTIIDGPGAEKLLGRGDMLFLPMGASRAVRAQGSFIGDGEIQALVDWWRGQGKPTFDESILAAGRQSAAGEGGEDSERFTEAARIVVRAGYGSVSLLQRKMRIGYVTAARLVDQLEERGIVGPAQGSNPREVLMGLDALERTLRTKSPQNA
jgi:S-DNA-T family DNA segregation ATPase FtsK/SpoIIIE